MKSFIEKHKLLNHPFVEIIVWFILANTIILFGIGTIVGLMEQKIGEHIVVPLIFSSALFGLSHITNLFIGASFGITMLQIFSAAAAGVFMGAVYLRTGSFLPGMLVHFLHDLLSYMEYGVGASVGEIEAIDITEVVIFTIVQIVLTYFLIKGKNESMQTVWEKIWVYD